jgi:hypothetical protein
MGSCRQIRAGSAIESAAFEVPVELWQTGEVPARPVLEWGKSRILIWHRDVTTDLRRQNRESGRRVRVTPLTRRCRARAGSPNGSTRRRILAADILRRRVVNMDEMLLDGIVPADQGWLGD